MKPTSTGMPVDAPVCGRTSRYVFSRFIRRLYRTVHVRGGVIQANRRAVDKSRRHPGNY